MYTYISLCVCIYVYMYIHTHTYIHIHMHIQISIFLSRFLCSAYTCVRIEYANMRLHMCVYVYTYMYMHLHVHAQPIAIRVTEKCGEVVLWKIFSWDLGFRVRVDTLNTWKTENRGKVSLWEVVWLTVFWLYSRCFVCIVCVNI